VRRYAQRRKQFSGYLKQQILALIIQVRYLRGSSLICFSNRDELEIAYISFCYSSRTTLEIQRLRSDPERDLLIGK
jgi:hypothetical protein